MAPPGDEHGIVTVNFVLQLGQHVKLNKLGVVYGEVGFLISSNPDTVRALDAAFVRRERIEETGILKGYRPGAPDLAVEVISPNDTYAEVHEKALEWLAAGTPMVVVLNPRKRTATIYRSLNDITILNEDDVLDLDEVVKGFKVLVKDIFG